MLGLTDALSLGAGDLPDNAFWAFIVVLHTEAVVALTCYFYIMFGDPGEVRRTPETCFPIPQEVADWMIAQSSDAPPAPLTRNVWGHEDHSKCGKNCSNHLYCVRCFVWRPGGTRGHHCRTCNRCVIGFDHHCGVFGRCIAEKNIACFFVLIFLAYFGVCTGAGFSITAIYYRVR